MKLQGAAPSMTHDGCATFSVTRRALHPGVGHQLRENTFFAQITLSVGGRDSRSTGRRRDPRPCSGAIYAAEEVISESAIEFEHDAEDSEDVVEKFKEFLDRVSPEDFAAGDS
jgi:hypothetical protein